MSYDPDFEKRFNNAMATIVENQARINEDLARMVEDRKATREHLNALIRIVEGDISNHP